MNNNNINNKAIKKDLLFYSDLNKYNLLKNNEIKNSYLSKISIEKEHKKDINNDKLKNKENDLKKSKIIDLNLLFKSEDKVNNNIDIKKGLNTYSRILPCNIIFQDGKLKIQDKSFINKSNDLQFIYNVEDMYKDGSLYIGEKINGKKNGNGKLIKINGSYFDGQWINNYMIGNGILNDKIKKTIYKGNFYENKYDGFGKLINLKDIKSNEEFKIEINKELKLVNWHSIKANFSENKMDEIAEINLKNGVKIISEIKQNKWDGIGKIIIENKKYFCFFQNNILNKIF